MVAALLAVIAWPTTRIHEATVQHAVCEEHGEIIDVAADAQTAGVEDGERWKSTASDEGGHEHCPFLALGQPGEPAAGVALREARLAAEGDSVPPSSEDRFVTVPLLCLAPKQSPPV